jgi:hypothetical protein
MDLNFKIFHLREISQIFRRVILFFKYMNKNLKNKKREFNNSDNLKKKRKKHFVPIENKIDLKQAYINNQKKI